jgi:hypothetical protein
MMKLKDVCAAAHALLRIIGQSAASQEVTLAVSATPQIGEPDDGGIYVGLSASDDKPLHVALADEPQCLTFDEAFEAAARMKKQPGRENAHVPTPEELNVNLYQNKDEGSLRGTFNGPGSRITSCYRSSSPYGGDSACAQWFDDGLQEYNYRTNRLPVRLVW